MSVSQVHLALGHGHDADYDMAVSWASTSLNNSQVEVFNEDGALVVALDCSTNWTQYERQDYVSPFLFTAKIRELEPRGKYSYTIGNGREQGVHRTFQAPPGARSTEEPFEVLVVGDLGQTIDSRQVVKTIATEMGKKRPAFLLHAGDMSYADCDETRWDSWFEMVEGVAQSLPWMTIPGNHEVEYRAETNTCFEAYEARFDMPRVEPAILPPVPKEHMPDLSAATDADSDAFKLMSCCPSAFTSVYDYGNSYYSFEYSHMHVIMLNSYAVTEKGSVQYQWLETDLQDIDRTRTPWVVAVFHSPWYNSNSAHQKEFNTKTMKEAMEPLFHKYGVDAVFNGHVHAYERSHPVFNDTVTQDGTVYIVVGDGGNREGHAGTYEEKPEWSARRNGKRFGHGSLYVTAASMKWVLHPEYGPPLDSYSWRKLT